MSSDYGGSVCLCALGDSLLPHLEYTTPICFKAPEPQTRNKPSQSGEYLQQISNPSRLKKKKNLKETLLFVPIDFWELMLTGSEFWMLGNSIVFTKSSARMENLRHISNWTHCGDLSQSSTAFGSFYPWLPQKAFVMWLDGDNRGHCLCLGAVWKWSVETDSSQALPVPVLSDDHFCRPSLVCHSRGRYATWEAPELNRQCSQSRKLRRAWGMRSANLHPERIPKTVTYRPDSESWSREPQEHSELGED